MNPSIQIARTVPNRGKTHIFLGNPLSDGCDKTTVEPGNNFSPGVWSCGISVWVEHNGALYSPDILTNDEITWSFGGEHNCPPIVTSQYTTKAGLHIKNELTHIGREGTQGTDFCLVHLRAAQDDAAVLYIVIRDIGPAGAKIHSMAWNAETNELLINSGILLTLETACTCEILPADDMHDSPMAILRCPISLHGSATTDFAFKVLHSPAKQVFGHILPKPEPFAGSVRQGFEESQRAWERTLPAKVFAPDARIAQTWEQCAFHILSAMECGLPRVGAVNYPLFWLRDGVIILRSLDLMGRHDLARIGNDYLAPLYFCGGFGAESDAPGEGIWALVAHAVITKDIDWLESVFFYIEKRVEFIERMLNATEIIRRPTDSRIPFYTDTAGINVLCFPAQNGTINGRMDWHSPNFFINCWAAGGLQCAAQAAALLQKDALAEAWNARAEALSQAIATFLLPEYGNDRDPIITPYPSGALGAYQSELAAQFDAWYQKNRLTPAGTRAPEPLWTYFEAAQIHNAILLGFRDEAWINLDGMLNAAGAMSAYIEGRPDGNENLPFRNGENKRGWLSDEALGGNMPHNWTSAEMVNLLRDMFVAEENGVLLLGKGVPKAWLQPGCAFGVTDMPTDFGIVSYHVAIDENGAANLEYHGPDNYRIAYGCTKNPL